MDQRVQIGGLERRREPAPVRRGRGPARLRGRRRRLLGRRRRDRPRPRAPQPRAARPPRGAPGRLDDWHREHPGRPDPEAYTAFLREIGYLLDEPAEVAVTTDGVDDEVARIAGPQLVVPLLNARFATNAVNARWGSLYDALYGTDVVPQEGDLAPGDGLQQGARRRGHRPRPGLPRRALPARLRLARRRHGVRRGRRRSGRDRQGRRPSGSPTRAQLVGLPRRAEDAPRRCCWSTTACTSRSRSTPRTRSASTDAAGVKDLLLESAVSTIMDLEDSVAAVDAEDKVLGYRNWLRLMDGTLAEEVTKGGKTFTRSMNPDRTYTHRRRRARSRCPAARCCSSARSAT